MVTVVSSGASLASGGDISDAMDSLLAAFSASKMALQCFIFTGMLSGVHFGRLILGGGCMFELTSPIPAHNTDLNWFGGEDVGLEEDGWDEIVWGTLRGRDSEGT